MQIFLASIIAVEAGKLSALKGSRAAHTSKQDGARRLHFGQWRLIGDLLVDKALFLFGPATRLEIGGHMLAMYVLSNIDCSRFALA